jgi:hypothetical protein
MNPMLTQQRPSAGSTRSIRFVALVFAGIVVLSAIGTATPGDVVRAANHKEGVVPVETINGIPVYRLPKITVTASRGAAAAHIEREKHATNVDSGKTQVSELHVAHGFAEPGDVAHLAGSPR